MRRGTPNDEPVKRMALGANRIRARKSARTSRGGSGRDAPPRLPTVTPLGNSTATPMAVNQVLYKR